MKKTVLLAVVAATMATPLTAAAQTTPPTTGVSSCRMVDGTNPNNWLQINPDKSWEAQVNGQTYRSSGFDILKYDSLDPTQVNFKDVAGVTVNGAAAPAEFRLVGRYIDARDKAVFEFKNVTGTTDIEMVDPSSPLDAHAFDCAAITI